MRTTRFTLAMLALVMATGACGSDGGSGPNRNGFFRVIHAVADGPDIDLLVDNQQRVSDLPFGVASGYLRISAGQHNFKVRASGTTTNIINEQGTIDDDSSYTVVAVGEGEDFGAVVMQDDRSAPSAGNGKMRVVHASYTVGDVDVYIVPFDEVIDIGEVDPALEDFGFGVYSNHAEFPSGSYRILLTTPDTKTVLIDSGELEVPSGSIQTLLALDDEGGGPPYQVLVTDDD